ncbi:MAG: DUF4288 domain-containing protein [Ferruginibacter sp.]
MNWYIVKLVYRFVYNQGMHTAQFSEQLRLIHADDQLHAFHKARLVGEREAAGIIENNNSIGWKFIDVTEIHLLDKPTDGAEVWSCMHEEANAEMYIRSAQKQSAVLLQEGICCFVN